MKLPDISTFNVSQMFNDSKGKTSALLTAGWYGSIASITCMIYMIVFPGDQSMRNYYMACMPFVAGILTVSTGVLGVHHLGKDKDIADYSDTTDTDKPAGS